MLVTAGGAAGAVAVARAPGPPHPRQAACEAGDDEACVAWATDVETMRGDRAGARRILRRYCRVGSGTTPSTCKQLERVLDPAGRERYLREACAVGDTAACARHRYLCGSLERTPGCEAPPGR